MAHPGFLGSDDLGREVLTFMEGEVICHNDFAPYYVVFVDEEPRAIIDFDTAVPGSRIWDVACAGYRFVPLASDEHSRTLGLPRAAERGRRLRLPAATSHTRRPSRVDTSTFTGATSSPHDAVAPSWSKVFCDRL